MSEYSLTNGLTESHHVIPPPPDSDNQSEHLARTPSGHDYTNGQTDLRENINHTVPRASGSRLLHTPVSERVHREKQVTFRTGGYKLRSYDPSVLVRLLCKVWYSLSYLWYIVSSVSFSFETYFF